MARKLFVNIAVEDLDRSVDFFTVLGFSFEPRFTDETATCMLVGEDAYFMLLTRKRFADFRTQPLVDAATQTEAIYAFSVESREEVDRLADAALAGGGSPAGEPQDHGFMLTRSFRDPDGHHFEVFWMDPKAAEEGVHAEAAE
jgi:predicted lactoylglutathione lyase